MIGGWPSTAGSSSVDARRPRRGSARPRTSCDAPVRDVEQDRPDPAVDRVARRNASTSALAAPPAPAPGSAWSVAEQARRRRGSPGRRGSRRPSAGPAGAGRWSARAGRCADRSRRTSGSSRRPPYGTPCGDLNNALRAFPGRECDRPSDTWGDRPMTPRRIRATYFAALRQGTSSLLLCGISGVASLPRARGDRQCRQAGTEEIARPAGGVAVPARERNARPQPGGCDEGHARGRERRGGGLLAGRAATSDARELLERVLADCRAALGPRDPDTLVVEGNLAVTYICLEHFERGLDLLVGQRRGPRGGARRHPPPHDGRPAMRSRPPTTWRTCCPTRSRCSPGSPRSGPARSARRTRTRSFRGSASRRADRLGRRCGGRRGARGGPAGRGAVGGAARRADRDDPQQPRARHAALGRADLARAELERAATDSQTLLGRTTPTRSPCGRTSRCCRATASASAEPVET